LFPRFAKFVKSLFAINFFLTSIWLSVAKMFTSNNRFFNNSSFFDGCEATRADNVLMTKSLMVHVCWCQVALLGDKSLLIGLSHNWLVDSLFNHGFFHVLRHNAFSFLYVSEVGVLFCDNWKMFLFNQGGMFLMNNGLMVLMDVFLIDDWLEMLMNNVLVVLVEYVLLMFHKDILVVLVDDILMDFLHYGLSDMALNYFSFFDSINLLAFINLFYNLFFFMLDNKWCLIDLLNDHVSSNMFSM